MTREVGKDDGKCMLRMEVRVSSENLFFHLRWMMMIQDWVGWVGCGWFCGRIFSGENDQCVSIQGWSGGGGKERELISPREKARRKKKKRKKEKRKPMILDG